MVHLEIGKNRFSWNKPQTTIHNIIIGRLWLDHVSCHRDGKKKMAVLLKLHAWCLFICFENLKMYWKCLFARSRLLVHCGQTRCEYEVNVLWFRIEPIHLRFLVGQKIHQICETVAIGRHVGEAVLKFQIWILAECLMIFFVFCFCV